MISATPSTVDTNASRVPEDGPAPMVREDLGDDRIGRFGRYWIALSEAAGGVPDRATFDPATVTEFLPNLIVVEHLEGEDFRYRLLGTGVDWFTKRSYTGLRTSQVDGHGPGNRIHTIYCETLKSRGMIGCGMPYVGTSSICRSVRQIAVPFVTSTGTDQIISLIEFDLVPGTRAKLLPPAKRWVL
ncbi:MAG: PAS domain-containing protein [Thalassobaculaceae bacterium]|nr:PAS domain-containing protein [Thalassobaculaceae bacterium]